MTEQLNGKITTGEWDDIFIDGESLTKFMGNLDGELITLTYYISKTPINRKSAIEKFLKSHYEGLTEVDGEYRCGSSWTGIYAKNDTIEIGGHDITEELNDLIGKYCYLKIESKT